MGALLTFAPNPHYYLAPTTLLQNGGINASVVFNAPGGTSDFSLSVTAFNDTAVPTITSAAR